MEESSKMKEKSRTQYSLINMGVGFAGYFLNTIMGFVCRMIFVRTLPQAYLGVSGLFANILNMLSLAELGIGTAIVYALYKPLAEKDEEKISILTQFYGKAYRIIGIIVAVIGLGLMPFLNVLVKEKPGISESLYLIYFIYLFNTASSYFFSYRSSVLSAAQKNYIVLGVSYIVTTLQSVIQIVFLLLTKNYIIYLIIQTIGTWVFNIVVSELAKKEFPCIVKRNDKKLSTSEMKELIKNVKSLVILRLSEFLINGVDNIIITYFNGLIAVGQASNYTLLSGTLSTLTNQLFNSLTASVGNFNAIESKERKLKFFYNLNMANFWIFGWATIGIFVVSSDIVKLFFGEKYVLSISIPFVLALNFFLVTMQSSVTTYKNTLGLFYYGRYIFIITAFLNLFFSIVLGKIWGLFGIYLATALARILTNNWYMPYALFKYGLEEKPRKYFQRYIFYWGLLLFTGGICYIACSYVNFNIVINVILKIVICSVVTNLIFYVTLHKKEEYDFLENKFQDIFKGMKKIISK